MKKLFSILFCFCCICVPFAVGDWDPSQPHKMHYPQLPQIEGGWDVCMCCQWLADDFRCTETGTIDDIHLWVSFMRDDVFDLIDPAMWDISIHADAGGIPGPVLWHFMGGNIAVRPYAQGPQGWVCPSPPPLIVPPFPTPDHSGVWQVNFTHLMEPMVQYQGNTYWLVVKVNLPWLPPPSVGWKNSASNPFQKPAMFSVDGYFWQPIQTVVQDVQDLAFVITGNPLQPELDFGDAPDFPTAIGYPTLLINNGARHIIGGPWLGDAPDAPDGEADGQPTVNADGDDLDLNGDDEDGAIIPVMYQGVPAYILLWVSGGGGVVEYWIDFNQNKVWEPAELIYNTYFPDGNYNMYVTVPANAVVGQTYARFRISTAGVGSPTGPAWDGEVEDYPVIIEEGPKADLGDAPDSTNSSGVNMTAYPAGGPPGVLANYPTVFSGTAPYGPKHWAPLSDAWLGQGVTLEDEADSGVDQDPTNNIIPVNDQPDMDGADDGLVLPVNMPRCKWTNVDYTVNVPSTIVGVYYVNIWCDFNRDGDWNDQVSGCALGDVPEWAVRNQMLVGLSPGLNTVTSLPFVSWHPTDGPAPLWMRITISEQPWQQAWGAGGCGPSSGYAIGETEDYLVLPDTTCTECADLNCDRLVDLSDFAMFASQWLSTCP